jgi:DNA polymerase-2
VKREAFLLKRSWRDTDGETVHTLWATTEEGPLHINITGQQPLFFVRRGTPVDCIRRREVALKDLQGRPVDAVYFRCQRDLVRERQRLHQLGILPLEGDIKPVERFLMERHIQGSFVAEGPAEKRGGVTFMNDPHISPGTFTPTFRMLSLDIETDGLDGALFSIAGVCGSEERVFLVAQNSLPSFVPSDGVRVQQSEREAISAFLEWVAELDPDLLVGWNLIDFDLKFLADRCAHLRIPFNIGRNGSRGEIIQPRTLGVPCLARLPGRIALDGIMTLRNASLHFESYDLADVAEGMLGREKKIQKNSDPVEEIRRMAHHDPAALIAYNLEDCRLVLEIFDRVRLIEFAVERQRLTGLAMDHAGGSIAAFDQLYLPRLHRAGFVAGSVGQQAETARSPGGYVMDSTPGLYENVLVLDFKSLYPSIVRTFCIDPLGLALATDSDAIPGFDGARFAREGHLLPEIVTRLWEARDEAKKQKNAALSQAIKIMMNSFYGVLGTPRCRFFDHRLVSSITKRGHRILGECRSFLEARDLNVIYGDTDSVFVLLGPGPNATECAQRGAQLASDLTEHFERAIRKEFGIQSHLELEFETHFRRFLMPTMRGSDVGTKKRYAGTCVDETGASRLIFKGMEAVRTDWTPLARSFQTRLFELIFEDRPYVDYIRQVAQDLKQAKLDDQLIYRKRLRRLVSEYESNVPPHVQAARQLERPGRYVSYVITTKGPEPIEKLSAPPDYVHYLNRQLAPAADSLLYFLGTSFARIAGPQLNLF